MKRILTTAAAALLSTSALAGDVSASAAKLTISGTSTVQAWKCEAKTVDTTLTLAAGRLALPSVAEDVTGAKVRIATAALDCKNGTMNDHLRDALKAKQHASIQFKVKSVSGEATAVKLHGELTLAGVTRAITVPATVTQQGTALRARGQYVLNMKDYGIKPPSLMFGTMNVGEEVTLDFEVTVPSSPVPASVGSL